MNSGLNILCITTRAKSCEFSNITMFLKVTVSFFCSLQTEYARFENGRFVYRISRSPMCEYMINFIHKLKHLPEKYMMNSVLENFTILLVITSLTWVGKLSLRDSHSSSPLCCQGVLVGSSWEGRRLTGPRDEFLLLVLHCSHSTGDETQCAEPHYLQGKRGGWEGAGTPVISHHMGS